MENVTVPAGVSVSGGQPPPAPPIIDTAGGTPPAGYTPPPQPAPPMQSMSSPSSNPVATFFKNANWVEIGMMILGAFAMISIVYYYKQKKLQDITDIKILQNKVEALQSEFDAKTKENQAV